MNDAPESLALHFGGGRVRGVVRFERDDARMRPFFFGLFLFAACVVYATRMAAPEHAPYAFAVAFLILVGTAPFGLAVINPPRDLNLEAGRLTIGDDEVRLAQIEDIRVEPDGRVIRLVLVAGGVTHVFPLMALAHSEEDVSWLADFLRHRADAAR